MMAIILLLLLFGSGRMDYSYKRFFALKNGVLICIGFLAAALLFVCFSRWKDFWANQEKHSDKAVSTLTKVFFLFQIYICFNAYFYTGWDAAVINNGALELALNHSLSDIAYFSRYTNNLLLVSIFSMIKKVDMFCGILDVKDGIMCILCVQCLISSVTGYLVYKIVCSLSGYRCAWAAWFCYLILVGSSGWLLIPYSDSFGLFFPTMILYLYQQLQNRKYTAWKWLAIGALSGMGYHIKPQIFIVFIAIVVVEYARFKTEIADEEHSGKSGILYALAGLLLTMLLCHVLISDIKEPLDSEKNFGMTHYAMMGLNSVNNGGYLSSDVEFSDSFATKSERTAANVEVIGQRLREMGVSGLKTHLAKKLLTNYGDGTFAWKNEGNFFLNVYEQKNRFFSPLLRNIIWGDGKMNLWSETVRQMVWVCILAASLGLIGYRKSADNVLLAVSWTIVGLTLFELIFEARARYLYIYVPFYIISGVLGAVKIPRKNGQKITKKN